MRSRRLLLAAVLALLGAPATARAADCGTAHWVGSWLANPGDAATAGFQDQTLRQIITAHRGGDTVRLHLSNHFGSQPVTFGGVALAQRQAGGTTVSGTSTAVTFGGRPSVTAAPGADIVSDPVGFRVAAFEDVAVSLYVAGASGPATEHLTGRQTSFSTPPGAGDHTADQGAGAFSGQTSTARFYVSGLEVMAPGDVSAVAAFGDSITDGFEGNRTPVTENSEGIDANGRYPDDLQRRLLAAGRPGVSVINAGISGNRILQDGQIPQFGPKGIARLRADALEQAGVTDVIILEGINDIGQSGASADEVIAGLRDLVTQVHAAPLRVLLGTLTPAGGTIQSSYGSADADATRRRVNDWIRTQSVADAVVDFDAAVRDQADPSRMQPRYDSSDHLHPSLAGYRAMADAVDLSQLKGGACAPPPARAVCRSRRAFTVHVPRAYRAGLRRAIVSVQGRRTGILRRVRTGAHVDLRGRPAGTVTVRLRIQRAGRRDVIVVRRFHPCSAASRHSVRRRGYALTAARRSG